MSNQTKPSIVFVHGIWADGSSFRARPTRCATLGAAAIS